MATLHDTVHTEPATTLAAPKARLSFWTLFWAGLGFALLLLVVGLVSYWVFGGAESRFVDPDAQRVEYRTKVYNDRVTEDAKYLKDEPSWFDKNKGLVRVPIEEAVTMTIPTLQAERPHAAYPLSKSPPQPAAAPTSPSLAGTAGVPAGNNAVNPPASNPTVGQPSPAPVAAGPAPAAPVAKSSPAPAAPATQTPAPGPSPATAVVPEPAAPAGQTPAPTPFPAQTPVGLNTPMPSSNNVNNPGNAPIPGANARTPAPSPAAAPGVTPSGGAAAEPLAKPVVQPSPAGNAASSGSTPTPAPAEPGVTPGGTPR